MIGCLIKKRKDTDQCGEWQLIETKKQYEFVIRYRELLLLKCKIQETQI
jgi:hypothetical protein